MDVQQKRHDEIANQMKAQAKLTEESRTVTQNILGRSPSSIPEFQQSMTELLPALDEYDRRVDGMLNILQQYDTEQLYVSDQDRDQTRALEKVFGIRKEQSLTLREEAEAVIGFRQGQASWSDIQTRLNLLDSDIESSDKRAEELMASAGLK